MTEASAVALLFNTFVDAFTAAQPTTPIQVENTTFVEPDPTLDASSWVRATVVHNTPVRETIGAKGNRRIRYSGTFYVQLFTPLASGLGFSLSIGASIGLILQLVQLGPAGDQLITDVTGRGETGDDGRWCMSTYSTAFRYYQRG